MIADTASTKVSLPEPRLPQIAPVSDGKSFTLTLAPDPSVFDGSFANNAWLQECPKPFTKQVWGNALHIGASDAQQLGLVDGDVLRLTAGRLVLEAPVLVRQGQAPRTIAATLGYGRTAAGSMGSDVGFDVYRMRPVDSPWSIDECQRQPDRQQSKSSAHAAFLQARRRSQGFTAAAYACRFEQVRPGFEQARRQSADALSAAQIRHLRMGDGDRQLGLHRLQRLRRRLSGRE